MCLKHTTSAILQELKHVNVCTGDLFKRTQLAEELEPFISLFVFRRQFKMNMFFWFAEELEAFEDVVNLFVYFHVDTCQYICLL